MDEHINNPAPVMEKTNGAGRPAAQPEPADAPRLPSPESAAGNRELAETPSPLFLSARLLWQERPLITKITGIGLLAATLVAFLIPNEYTSTVRLMPPETGGGYGKALMLSSMAGAIPGLSMAGNLLGLKSAGDLFIGILRSETVEDRIINRFDLRKRYSIKTYAKTREKLDSNTYISEDRKSGIISLAVTDRSPARAAAMAQAYVDELDRLSAELNTSAAHRERVFIGGRLKVVSAELAEAEKQFSQFASKNATLDVKEQAHAMFDSAAKVEGELIASRSELSGLEQIYSANNVRVQAAKARIAELERQLAKLGGTPMQDPPSGGGAANAGYPSIRELPLLGVPYEDLYRNVKVEEAIYEALIKQYEIARVEEARETPSVRVLDPPLVPERKSAPRRSVIILLCTALVFFAGAIFVMARARWNAIDSGDERKIFARQFLQDVRLAGSGNGFGRLARVGARTEHDLND